MDCRIELHPGIATNIRSFGDLSQQAASILLFTWLSAHHIMRPPFFTINRSLHELKYLARGGSDLQINIFFDAETYQHVRTEYLRVIPAPTGSRAYANVEERETRYKMVEQFSDFKNESGLNLPHTYKIRLDVDSQSGTFSADWAFNLTRFVFNEPIDPTSFSISAE